jgi:hypothetical protein
MFRLGRTHPQSNDYSRNVEIFSLPISSSPHSPISQVHNPRKENLHHKKSQPWEPQLTFGEIDRVSPVFAGDLSGADLEEILLEALGDIYLPVGLGVPVRLQYRESPAARAPLPATAALHASNPGLRGCCAQEGNFRRNGDPKS